MIILVLYVIFNSNICTVMKDKNFFWLKKVMLTNNNQGVHRPMLSLYFEHKNMSSQFQIHMQNDSQDFI